MLFDHAQTAATDMDMQSMQMMNPLTDEPCDPGVANLTLWDTRCYTAVECCTAFMDAENELQAITPWIGWFRYGRYLVYYWVVIVFLAMLRHVSIVWSNTRASRSATTSSSGTSFGDRLQAGGRFVFYRRFGRTPSRLISIPHGGVLSLLVISIIFTLALAFTERPYYREFFQWGSPPLAIRTGLMAFACLPLMIALAGKVNILTLLTGYSYEKLNIIHQWVAWLSFVLSVVHTIPVRLCSKCFYSSEDSCVSADSLKFFVASVNERGNGGFARVKSEFYRNNGGPLTEVCARGLNPHNTQIC